MVLLTEKMKKNELKKIITKILVMSVQCTSTDLIFVTQITDTLRKY